MHIRWEQIAPRFYGTWVAIADDQATVLASGKTATEALQKAQKAGHRTLIITHLPDLEDETPTDELIAAMREGEDEDRAGKLTYYDALDDFFASLH